MSWTDERVELLKKLWNQGLSASQIAAELGGGVTRNAVIGKVHRLGLSGRAKAPAPAAARPRKATRAPSHPMSHVSTTTSVRGNLALSSKPAASPQAMVYIAPAPRPEIEVVVPMSERVTIMELRSPCAGGRMVTRLPRISASVARNRRLVRPIAGITRRSLISPRWIAGRKWPLRGCRLALNALNVASRVERCGRLFCFCAQRSDPGSPCGLKRRLTPHRLGRRCYNKFAQGRIRSGPAEETPGESHAGRTRWAGRAYHRLGARHWAGNSGYAGRKRRNCRLQRSTRDRWAMRSGSQVTSSFRSTCPSATASKRRRVGGEAGGPHRHPRQQCWHWRHCR